MCADEGAAKMAAFPVNRHETLFPLKNIINILLPPVPLVYYKDKLF